MRESRISTPPIFRLCQQMASARPPGAPRGASPKLPEKVQYAVYRTTLVTLLGVLICAILLFIAASHMAMSPPCESIAMKRRATAGLPRFIYYASVADDGHAGRAWASPIKHNSREAVEWMLHGAIVAKCAAFR